MVLLHLSDGTTILYDCNVTEENAADILTHLSWAMGSKRNIDIFVCSHRDSDHMRGIKLVHSRHPIQKIWDSGVPGTTPSSSEYGAYMDLRRKLPLVEVESRKKWDFGDTLIRVMNSKWPDYSDANTQSIVLKVEYGGSSVLLAGDTDYRPWKEKILPFYVTNKLASSILLAPHHGSITFFDDPSDTKNYYLSHIKKISPAMTIISVGPNVHGLPDSKAVELYSHFSSGSNKGNKVYRTDKQGNMKLALKPGAHWTIWKNQ